MIRWVKVFIGVMIILVAYTSAANYSDKFIYTVMAIGLAVIIKNVFFYKKKEDANRMDNSVPTDTTSSVRQAEIPKIPEKPKRQFLDFKLAGVTFDNEDGTSRQKKLKEMYMNGTIEKEDSRYLSRLEAYDPKVDDITDKPFPPSRYTESFTLGIDRIEEDDGLTYILISVDDVGIGVIPKEQFAIVDDVCFSGNYSHITMAFKVGRFLKEEKNIIYFVNTTMGYDKNIVPTTDNTDNADNTDTSNTTTD